jgi:hypothetical protein
MAARAAAQHHSLKSIEADPEMQRSTTPFTYADAV